ncbi:MAG TPA: hypothetical protein VGB06_05230 [Solirubrobacterales bacterium]|jgi:hypothetical protein
MTVARIAITSLQAIHFSPLLAGRAPYDYPIGGMDEGKRACGTRHDRSAILKNLPQEVRLA